jgi:signal transduction histidine kinase
MITQRDLGEARQGSSGHVEPTSVDLFELLQWGQLVVFTVITLAALRLWRRHRTAPASYLTLALALLTGALLWSRVIPPDSVGFLGRLQPLNLVAFAAFPWLLAAFAWSFEGRLPRWLRLSSLLVVALGLWGLLVAPLAAGAPDPEERQLYLDVFSLIWTGFSLAAVQRLWRSGGSQRLVRSRMRLMAAGVFVMNAALLAAGRPQAMGLALLATVLALTAAALFVLGFAPPLPLRLWWRRRSWGQVEQMQGALIGAATPPEIAQAVVPEIADLLGGAVAIVGGRGEVLGAHGFEEAELSEAVIRLALSEPMDDRTQVFAVDGSRLLVRTDPYTPVFGRGELELVEEFSWQLRLALERAELFEANLSAQAAADRAAGELEATLVGLAHDLRSPTAAISGFAALLGEIESDEQRAEILGHIQESSRYVDALIRALLEFAGVGRTQLEVQPVELSRVASIVAERFSVTDPQATVTVQGRLPAVLANPLRMEQLLDNLVGNSVRHAGRPDVTVTIWATATDEGVRLAVEDDGRGVPPEDHERIFALFQRGRAAARDGSGVGLGMVRRIAESYGGDVRLDTSRSRGARFLVDLPATMLVEDDVPYSPEDTDGAMPSAEGRQLDAADQGGST